MAIKQVHYSELTGKLILEDREIVKVRVIEHPALTGKPVVFEAASGELKGVDKMALTVAVVELELPGEEPARVVLDAAAFDKLCTDGTMAELLAGSAKTPEIGGVKRPPSGDKPDRTNYASLEHAGRVHRGKVTAEEARIVRDHLAEVNERLAAEGHRQIDPANEEHQQRYGVRPSEVASTSDPVPTEYAAPAWSA